MFDSQQLAVAALAGLTTKGVPTADRETGGKHDANGCGGDVGCMGQNPGGP